MPSFGTRLGTRFGTKLGTSWPGGGAPLLAAWIGGRLTPSYTGPLFRVRRTSDSTTLDIGCATGTDLYDAAALATFCAGTDGLVGRVYLQDGSGRFFVQATAGQQ